jgi:uncharacterized Zn-finger protein
LFYSDVTILEAEEAETVDKEQPAAPTQQDEPLQKDDNDTPRPYPCAVCDKSFKKSSHLKQHMRSHTGKLSFSSNIVVNSFTILFLLT